MQIFQNKPVKESSVLVAEHFAIHTYPQCSVASSSGGEESFPNIRGIKKSLPQLSSSANTLSKNISSTTEKTVHQTLEDDRPSDFFKKGNRVTKSHQKSSNMNAGPSWNKVQRSKNPSGKRQSQFQVPHVSSQPPAHGLQESGSPEGKPERSPLGPRRRGASGNELFLDLRCMKILKEGAGEDEDSASDLSDSERVPVPPSSRAPPELHLRAEEIDAADPGPDPDAEPQGSAQPAYQYADFLPAPFSARDLRDLAVPPGAEPRPAARSGAAGLLARYIDRLVQLEWLQIQTVQGEKGKGAKARPPTAPGLSASGTLKSPGRSKPGASAPARPPQEGACKLGASGASRRKELPREEARPSYYAFDTAPKTLHVRRGSRPSSRKPALDVTAEEQRKKASKSPRLQRWDLPCRDGGGPGAPTQGVTARDSADPGGPPRPQAHAGLQKKGGASRCAHATTSSEKKPKANGVKQSTCKFKDRASNNRIQISLSSAICY
uniref:protein FAM217B isoform X1 n=3 Tax=Halichoerus grypus TaxID=9711 RepID=UPI001659C8B0|nr:protein FAM217B isoform X1 [Halichoerus grypus]